jgi:hypothetical protein
VTDPWQKLNAFILKGKTARISKNISICIHNVSSRTRIGVGRAWTGFIWLWVEIGGGIL